MAVSLIGGHKQVHTATEQGPFGHGAATVSIDSRGRAAVAALRGHYRRRAGPSAVKVGAKVTLSSAAPGPRGAWSRPFGEARDLDYKRHTMAVYCV